MTDSERLLLVQKFLLGTLEASLKDKKRLTAEFRELNSRLWEIQSRLETVVLVLAASGQEVGLEEYRAIREDFLK